MRTYMATFVEPYKIYRNATRYAIEIYKATACALVTLCHCALIALKCLDHCRQTWYQEVTIGTRCGVH